MEKLRCFIAIDPDSAVVSYLQKVRSEIETRANAGAIRWVEPEQAHLTLQFLGNVAADDILPLKKAIAEACSGTRSFALMPDKLGAFPTLRRPKVIWIGLSGDLRVLNALQENIERAVACFSAEKANHNFSPHLTLGRARSIQSRELRKISDALHAVQLAPGPSWRVRHVQLIQSSLGSHGAVHQPIGSVELET